MRLLFGVRCVSVSVRTGLELLEVLGELEGVVRQAHKRPQESPTRPGPKPVQPEVPLPAPQASPGGRPGAGSRGGLLAGRDGCAGEVEGPAVHVGHDLPGRVCERTGRAGPRCGGGRAPHRRVGRGREDDRGRVNGTRMADSDGE